VNTECDRVLRWLNETDDPTAPAGSEAHAAVCETCRRHLEMERTLRGRLGAGAALEPAHRTALLDKITAAPRAAGRRRWLRRWSWVPVAAAAAVILAFLLVPETREPIPPTDIIADLLGPFAEAAPVEEPPAPKAEEELPLGQVLAAFWADFEGPLSVGRGALEAPRAAAAADRTPEKQ